MRVRLPLAGIGQPDAGVLPKEKCDLIGQV